MNIGLQTIRLWNPLFPQVYLRDESGNIAAEPTAFSSSRIIQYQKEIEAVIQQQRLPDEEERGLAIYLDEGRLNEAVCRISPSVEAYAGQLWGVTEVQTYRELTETEQTEVADWLSEQFYDGWGGILEQCPIMTREGELYLSFWSSDYRSFVREESEMLRELSEHPGQWMG